MDLARAALAGIALVVMVAAAHADDDAPAPALSVIELFTSHGCSSCPPADALLGDLIEQRDDLIALEWHVDYWNTLVHGGDGSWVDPFSQPAWSARQRNYNTQGLQGRPGVYTPQAIVNGRYAAVGSDSRSIAGALDEAVPAQVLVDVTRDEGGLLIATEPVESVGNRQAATSGTGASTPAPTAEVWLVQYRDSATTAITAGENRDLKLTNHHIVTGMQHVGSTGDERLQWRMPAPEGAGNDCAVLVQNDAQAALLGAARCP